MSTARFVLQPPAVANVAIERAGWWNKFVLHADGYGLLALRSGVLDQIDANAVGVLDSEVAVAPRFGA